MIRKIKGFAAVLVAAMALGAMSVSVAQAGEIHFTTGAHTVFFGEQHVQNLQFKLTASNNSTSCTQALFEGTHAGTAGAQQSTTQDITLTGTYTGCTCFGVACQVKMNGCKYTLTGENQPALTFKVDIRHCTQTDGKAATDPTGSGVTKSIELVSLIGTLTTPEQATIGGHITFANVGTGQTQDLTGQITLQGIGYECHGSIPACAATTLTSDGDITGQITLIGRLFTGTELKTHNGHQYLSYKKSGEQKGLFVT